MHCHLRPPVPLVLLGFNREAGPALRTHNAPSYQNQPNRAMSFKVTNLGINGKPLRDFLSIIVAYVLSCTVSEISLIISQIFDVPSTALTLSVDIILGL